MRMLDSLVRSLALTLVDSDSVQQYPSPVSPPQRGVYTPSPPSTGMLSSPLRPVRMPTPGGCKCASLTLGAHWPGAQEHCPMWANTPAWNSRWSEAEFRREECRRTCWTVASLTASHASFEHASHFRHLNYFMADPANVCISCFYTLGEVLTELLIVCSHVFGRVFAAV
jgi:hypothetical protein